MIIGTGTGAGLHATATAAHRDRAVVGRAVGRDPSRARAFANRHGIEEWGTDLTDALARIWSDGGKVELAHVCTPPGSHLDIAMSCLEAGVPVLLEKPPALSLAEVDELLAASERIGVDVGVVFQHRFSSGARRARELLVEGATSGEGVGRSLLATCHTLWYRDDDYFAVPWRGRWDIEGGGPTMSHGIHQLDLLLTLLGPWTEVTAMAGRQARSTETEDVSVAAVRFDRRTLATIVNSVVSPRQTSVLRIDTAYATLELEHLYGYTDADWTFTTAPGHENLADRWEADGTESRSGHASQLGVVLDALDACEPLPVPLREARDTLELVTAIYASAFTGQIVRRGDIVPGHPFYRRMDGAGAPWTVVA